MHYLGRKSCDEVAARNGFLLSTDGIHLSDRAAAVVADLVARLAHSAVSQCLRNKWGARCSTTTST
jgi:hypothetical protein